MAGHGVPWLYLLQRRFGVMANFHDLQATRLETAARWRVNGLGDLTFDFGDGSLIGGVGDRDRGYEGLCIGVMGLGDYFLGDAQFHNPAQIHDH